MGIPNKLSPLTGGEGVLPKGYLPAEFVESTALQYFGTGVYPTSYSKIEFTYRIITSNTGVAWLFANADANRTETDKCFKYARGTSMYMEFGDGIRNPAIPTEGKETISFEKARVTLNGNFITDFGGVPNFIGTTELTVPRNLRDTNPNDVEFYACKLWEAGTPVRDYVPCISPEGQVIMYDKVQGKNYPATSGGEFAVGMTSLQALNLRKLPVVEAGTLTVSLPWEAQWDVGVQYALAVAATKGWTITVQYRDPEVATENIPTSFLQNSEAGRVTTDVLIGGDTVVECEFVPTTYNWVNLYYSAGTINTIPSFYGSYDYNNAYGRRFTFGYGQNKLIRFDGQAGMPGYSSQLGVKYTTKHGGGKFYINGALIYEVPIEEFESVTNLSLFGHPYNDVQGVKNCCVYRFKFSRGAEKQGDWFPSIDSQGVPCFYDKVQEKSFYLTPITEGAILIAGFDTVAQARNLAHLPDVTAETNATKKSLTVSLPWEAQLVITGVPAALQVAADRGWTITVQYRDPEADNIYYNKYAACTKQADMIAVNANYKSDLTADGKWIYPLPKLSSGDQVFNGVQISEVDVNEFPLIGSGYFMFASNKAIKRFTTRMPKMNWFDRTFHNTSLEVFDYDGETFSPQVIQVGFNACKNFRTFNAVFGRKIVNANFAFSECILDKPSVLRIANSAIPSSSGQGFYIGIHIDLQNDTEVLDALALMETNGWVLTTQWNGTATAAAASVSTFGLRSPAIYAKLNTIEFSGGTTETLLDWGHYVTNWEERGYQEFASLEAAKEYFNINQTE